MARIYAIILAGGRGLRLNRDTPKQFLPLAGRPVVAWSLLAFNSLDEIDAVITVIPGEFIPRAEEIIKAYNICKAQKPIPGGPTRQDSACNALRSRDFHDDDILLFHDAARPFIKPDIIRGCISAVQQHGAAAVYVPTHDTIAEARDGFIVPTPPRDNFYSAQTPQAFLYSVINSAHLRAAEDGISATDDASLVVNAGFAVKLVQGDYFNFKITSEADYHTACLLAEKL
jgi:2-C-methyl-D-erythritol 4-phosphate cytidylyltransferase